MHTTLTGFLLALSLCLDIGVVNIAMIDASIRHGPRPAIWMGLGSCFGDLTYALLSLLGMGYLLQFTWVKWLTWLVGGGVMLLLSLQMAREAWRDAQHSPRRHKAVGRRSLLRQGFILALASPSAILWFAAVGGSLIAQSTDGSAIAIANFLSGFFAGGLAWTIFLAYCASHGGKLLGARFAQGCHLLSALLYLWFAAMVLSNGYHTLWRQITR